MRNLSELLYQSAERFGNRITSQIREGEGWRKLSYRQLRDASEALARALKAKGFGSGDAIAILSENRPEWGLAYFAIGRIDSVVVPLDKLLKKHEMQNILESSSTKLILTSAHYLNLIRELPLNIPVISLDPVEAGASTLAHAIEEGLQYPALGNPISTPDSIAMMIFTSGTTGNPKGVMLTHGNLLSNVDSLGKIFPASFFESNFLSILPLNHTFELTAGFLTPLRGGATITYQDTLKPPHVLQTMRDTGTRVMLTVPAFLEVLLRSITQKVEEHPQKRKKFKLARRLARLLPFQSFRRWLFKDLHHVFGGHLQYFVSGGAPLSGEVQEAFEELGFTVVQGYGLTETSPVLTVNPFYRTRKYSVGRPLPGVEIRIDGEPDGEILAKGPNIMKGYYNNPEATAEVMREGYFCTGDIGYFDREGYLYISGRQKNLIVTSAGKKVFPEEVEEKLKSVPYLKEVCVLGRKSGVEESVLAVVIPDQDKLKADDIPVGEIRGRIWDEIKKINAAMAEYKRVKDLILWEGEFPKTTTLKIKRRELERLVQEQIKEKVTSG